MQENTQNKNSLDNTLQNDLNKNNTSKYLKILISILIILFVSFSVLYYFKKNTNVSIQNNQSSFPDISIGDDLSTDTYTDQNEIQKNKDEKRNDNEDENDNSGLINVWPLSVTGYGVLDSKGNGTSTEIIFSDALSGNIYTVKYPEKLITRITNTTIANIFLSSFSKDGDYVLALQKNSKDNTLNSFDLIGSRLGKEKDGSFVSNDIDKNVFDIVPSKNENVFYYLKNTAIGSVLNSYNINTGKIIKITDLLVSDIFILKEDSLNIYLSSKSSSEVSGVAITINKKSGLKKYIKTGSNLIFEKCAANDIYSICAEDESGKEVDVDAWNMGLQSFSDNIVVFNFTTKETFVTPASLIVGEALDIYKTSLIKDNFLFQNKNDNSLWLFN